MEPAEEKETNVSNQTPADNKVHRYRCPECGADLLFDPKNGCLTCSFCNTKEEIPQDPDAVQERSFEKYFQKQELQVISSDAQEVACQSCGAIIVFTPPEVAKRCDFCTAAIVAQPKNVDPIVAPEAVLPFKIEKQEATDEIRTWLSSRWFAPNALKRFAQPGALTGIYIPFWTYDAYATSFYTGLRGVHYYVTEYYTTTDSDGNPIQQTRQVQKTQWYPAAGKVERWFDDILVPATQTLSQQKLNELEPWDLAELKSYEPAYLSGFKAQRYQIDLAKGFEIARTFAAKVIRSDVNSAIGGDVQQISSIKTHYSGVTFKHVLLPVYVAAYTLGGKLYQVLVNARTGEVQGERPYSWIKITLAILLVLAIIAGIAYWYQQQLVVPESSPSSDFTRY